jgi:nucleoside-diphosphate-sugar epimerase
VGELFRICSEIIGTRIRTREKKLIDDLFLRLRRQYHKHRKHMDFITYLMAGPGRRVHRAYSIEETHRALGFSPRVTLQRGIADTLHWAGEAGILAFADSSSAVPRTQNDKQF